MSIQCKEDCAINKYCDLTTGTCACKNGSKKDDCSLDCDPDCINRGTCDLTTGKCICKNADCSLICPNNCSGHGTCDKSSGQCTCDDKWSGERCCISKTALGSTCVSPNPGCEIVLPGWKRCL